MKPDPVNRESILREAIDHFAMMYERELSLKSPTAKHNANTQLEFIIRELEKLIDV